MNAATVANVLFGRGDSAREVFLAWEGLRIVFNGVLGFLTVTLAAAFGVAADFDLWSEVAVAGFVANVCFCAGPCAEGYLSMVRLDRRFARGLIFAAGLSLTSLGVLAAVAAAAVPSF